MLVRIAIDETSEVLQKLKQMPDSSDEDKEKWKIEHAKIDGMLRVIQIVNTFV